MKSIKSAIHKIELKLWPHILRVMLTVHAKLAARHRRLHHKVVFESSLVNARYTICQNCPAFRATTKTCRDCGCFMPAKVQFEKATCPRGHW